MKGGGDIYPNKGVKIDPRSLTSARMPESLKVYSGYLYEGYEYLKGEGMITNKDIERENQKIQGLIPFNITKDKLLSSHWFKSDIYAVEFFRTSLYNYKIYALKILFFEESSSLFRK
jgi:hypothetical protein